jgi:hypothetical protein
MILIVYGIDDKMKIKPRTRSVRSITSLILALRLALVDFLIFKTAESFADLTKSADPPFVSCGKKHSIRGHKSFRVFPRPQKQDFATPAAATTNNILCF